MDNEAWQKIAREAAEEIAKLLLMNARPERDWNLTDWSKIILAAIEKAHQEGWHEGRQYQVDYGTAAQPSKAAPLGERSEPTSESIYTSDIAECAACGEQLQAVRPGKFQHVGKCEPTGDQPRPSGWTRADLIEWAWTIIANAGGGNWDLETKDWQDAAAKWRDVYHGSLPPRPSESELQRRVNQIGVMPRPSGQEDRPAPIPGPWIAVQSSNPAYPHEWDVKEGGKSGYSVIGDGFITEGQAKEIALRHNLTLPRPSGQEEWTPEFLRQVATAHWNESAHEVFCRLHNAALAAKHHKYRDELRQWMDENLKLTDELCAAQAAIAKIRDEAVTLVDARKHPKSVLHFEAPDRIKRIANDAMKGNDAALREHDAKLAQELEAIHSQERKGIREHARKPLVDALRTYKKAIDLLYSHNEATRAAVVMYFGMLHPQAALDALKAGK